MKSHLVVALASFVASATAHAQSDCDACKPTGCADGGMECVYSCRPVIKKVPVEKECFEVKSEYICVPPVQLPRWCGLLGFHNCGDTMADSVCADCSPAAAASGPLFPWQRAERESRRDNRIRKVHKLSKKEYECGEKCVVEWKLECLCRPISCTPPGACLSNCAPDGCTPLHWSSESGWSRCR